MNVDTSLIENLVYFIISIILFWLLIRVYYQVVLFRRIEGEVERIRKIDEKVQRMVVRRAKCDREEAETLVQRAANLFVVQPVQLDPHGIIERLENVIERSEDKFRSYARVLTGKRDGVEVNNMSMALTCVFSIHVIAQYLRHLLLSAKKTNNLQLLLLITMLLPTFKQFVKSNYEGAKAFLECVPIGDSVGPMVAARLIGDSPVREVEKGTVAAEKELDGRRLVIVKARGPGGNLGRLGRAVKKLVKEYGDVSKIITIDAALKLEGERTGKVSEGVGVAMGDPGHESYKIEQIAADEGIDLDAVAIKMSATEAVMPMPKSVVDAVEEAAERALELAKEAPEDSTVIIVGVGNTVGVPDNRPYLPNGGEG
ncbi:DUF1512 family protein [Methanopyrus sp.]